MAAATDGEGGGLQDPGVGDGFGGQDDGVAAFPSIYTILFDSFDTNLSSSVNDDVSDVYAFKPTALSTEEDLSATSDIYELASTFSKACELLGFLMIGKLHEALKLWSDLKTYASC
ncbi:hypothetical protein C4D60_Mb09t26870 [Musa balbisiana]|uniref:Uncharacterized protein n=1 Tax=Musa balbisiana TaxID=52838 RepID=A0A4S8IJB9_MUSBA|nr:hypothetical protein C4D60_Mb09t26870 [Musa balbisiana]